MREKSVSAACRRRPLASRAVSASAPYAASENFRGVNKRNRAKIGCQEKIKMTDDTIVMNERIIPIIAVSDPSAAT